MTQRAPLLPHTRIAAGARLLTAAQLQQFIGLALALTCGAYVLRQLHAGTAHAAVLVPSGGSRPHALATGGSVASVASGAGGGARGSGSATSLAGGRAAVAAGLGAGAAAASGAQNTPSAASQSLPQPAAASSAARGSGTTGEAAGAARAGAAAAAAAASNVAARVASGGAPSVAADAPPLELVVGVFITQNTRSDLIQAFRDGAAAFNAGLGPPAAARAVLVFFVGSTSHPLKQSEAGGAPDIVAGAFAENMNQGKTFEWWKHVAVAHPNASFVFKCDTDSAINWPALVRELRGAQARVAAAAAAAARGNASSGGGGDSSTADSSSALASMFVGHRNDHKGCGGFPHCPPKGCTEFDTANKCWVYASGGFYGMSGVLVRAVAACKWARANSAGYEDLQSGRMAQNCAPGGRAHMAHIRNGIAWCHSKVLTLDNVRLGTFPRGCGE